MGQYSVGLVGESNYQGAVSALVEGETVRLVHEPTNPYDANAVKAIDMGGGTIGYVERGSWLQDLVVTGKTPVLAEVEKIVGGGRGKPTKGVVLFVLTAKDAKARAESSMDKIVKDATRKNPTSSDQIGKGLGQMGCWLTVLGIGSIVLLALLV